MTTKKPSLSPCGLFASRDSLPEAVDYANQLIDTIPSAHRMAALTALHVTVNTALAEIEKLNLSTILPYAVADLPATLTVEKVESSVCLRILRTGVVPNLRALYKLHTIPLLTDYIEPMIIQQMLLARAFGMDVEEIIAESRAFALGE